MYGCSTGKFGDMKNRLLEYFDVHVGHVRKTCHINRVHQLTTRRIVSRFTLNTDRNVLVPLLFSFSEFQTIYNS